MNKLFQNVGGVQPPRSIFNLSYEKKFTCDMGQLIPVMCDEVVPGDIFDIGASMVIRFQPLVAPVLHQVDVSCYYFFVPYRLLWDDWEDFITGGPDGDLAPTIPRWVPDNNDKMSIGSLWDYFGFPTVSAPLVPPPVNRNFPVIFPPRAYAFVWNEYFRDETLQDEIDYLNFLGTDDDLNVPLLSNWEKDKFTSALLWQQRGTAPAIPIVGDTAAVWQATNFGIGAGGYNVGVDAGVNPTVYVNNAAGIDNLYDVFNANTVDLSGATPISISELRTAVQVQRWLERNARAGVRYTEFLKAQFGTYPKDERLDRPEYIGGMKAPVIFTEVLQTSETGTTPQGNLAGHGLSVTATPIGKYRVEEFGLILGVMRIMPKPAYQQGIDRQWIKNTKYDFFFPVFANLSEQEITRGELYWTGDLANDETVFGFCGAYDELRTKNNQVCGLFRTTYDYWHLGRQFGSAPALNSTFIQCSVRKDIFAVPSEPGCLVQFGNIIKALRPMPIIAEPGLMDHN